MLRLSKCSSLIRGVFIAVQDRENQDHTLTFMVGITRDAGDGTCIVEQVKERTTINGTRFDPGTSRLLFNGKITP